MESAIKPGTRCECRDADCSGHLHRGMAFGFDCCAKADHARDADARELLRAVVDEMRTGHFGPKTRRWTNKWADQIEFALDSNGKTFRMVAVELPRVGRTYDTEANEVPCPNPPDTIDVPMCAPCAEYHEARQKAGA